MNSNLTAKDKGVILGGLRTAFSRSSYAAQCRDRAVSTSTGPRGGKLYICANCGGEFNAGNINVDHINPVVSIGLSYTDYTWDELVNRLWCDQSNLQVLCKKCHDKKSKEERKLRKKFNSKRVPAKD